MQEEGSYILSQIHVVMQAECFILLGLQPNLNFNAYLDYNDVKFI